jgi:hypothetical protein
VRTGHRTTLLNRDDRDWAFCDGKNGADALKQNSVDDVRRARRRCGANHDALDWNLDAQQATSLVDFGAANSPTTNVGGEHPDINAANDGADDPLVAGLRALGHTVSLNAQSSGISTIIVGTRNGEPVLTGGADPRREGVVLGDTFRP